MVRKLKPNRNEKKDDGDNTARWKEIKKTTVHTTTQANLRSSSKNKMKAEAATTINTTRKICFYIYQFYCLNLSEAAQHTTIYTIVRIYTCAKFNIPLDNFILCFCTLFFVAHHSILRMNHSQTEMK